MAPLSLSTLTVADLQSAGLQAESLPGGSVSPRRTVRPKGVVWHTSGVTFAQQVLRKLPSDPFPDTMDAAAARAFDALAYKPGYLIGTQGKVYQLEPDDRRTHHAGAIGVGCPGGAIYQERGWRAWSKPLHGDGWQRHRRKEGVVYDWWIKAFPDAGTPLDVFPWHGRPNDAIGVDVLPDPRIGGAFSDAQVRAAGILAYLLAVEHGFPISPTTISTHSLAAPCERGTTLTKGKVIGVHWDPPARDWDHALTLRAAMGMSA